VTGAAKRTALLISSGSARKYDGRQTISTTWSVYFNNSLLPEYETVKATRSTLVVLITLLVVFAVVAVSLGTRSGRQAVRQASRAVRLVRNATRIYPSPVLMLRIWDRPRESVFQLELFESGRLVVSGQETVQETLSTDTAERLFHLGTVALGDFSSRGCEPWRNGEMNADLYVLISGEWNGALCRNSWDWPEGAGTETHRLLDQISRYLPKGVKLPVEF